MERGSVKVSDLLVRCLENEGVRYVFGVPGEEILDVLDALASSEQIRFVATRHEQGAAFMADVYGRLSTYPGVCLATLGPGATNLITGVADANLDRAPLVAITGQAARSRTFKESHQYVDVTRLMVPVTKWNTRIELPETVPEIVRKAFRLARLEPSGATHIELPEDVATATTDAQPMPVLRTTYPSANPDTIARAADVLRQSERPIILAGNGVIRRHAAGALAEFSQSLHIPVTTTFMGKGCLDYRDPLSLPALGLHADGESLGALGEADLVLALGYDLVEWAPADWNARERKRILHIDSTAAEVDTHYRAEVEVVGEIRDSLLRLSEVMGEWTAPDYAAGYRARAVEELESYASDESFPLKPQRIVHDLRSALGDEDILISDVGAHKLWLATRFPAARPNTVVIPNGLASMGIAVPGAVAARLVHPDRKVVAVTGDGGFLMNSQELETAKRLRLPMVVVVLVDNRYGVIELNQKRRFGRSFGVDFGNPDFVQYAQSFGVPAFPVRAAAELLPALRRALGLDEPALIAVPVDSSESPAALLSS